jgi:integrase
MRSESMSPTLSATTEARRLTNACAADFRALVTAALLTGCRYGELAAMTVNDLNPDAGTSRVRQSKGGRPRHVVLTAEGRDFFAMQAAGKAGGARLFQALRAPLFRWRAISRDRAVKSILQRSHVHPHG